MADLNDYPPLIKMEGNGIFSTKKFSFETSFEIIHYPHSILIQSQLVGSYSHFELLKYFDHPWVLTGHTMDKTRVVAKDLGLYQINGLKMTFIPYSSLCFGNINIKSITKAVFPLVGIYDNGFKLKIDGWEVSMFGEQDKLKLLKYTSKNWKIQLEGSVLEISKPGATKKQFVSIANDITSLLSLAIGNDVIFNRQLFYKNEQLFLEEWRHKVEYHFGVDRCIPDFKIEDFLKQTLTNYQSWDHKKKKLFFSTVTYINSTSKGYLEDRLLRICIAWEGLAKKWLLDNPVTTIDELKPLKKSLKRIIQVSELPKDYKKELLISRVLKVLDYGSNVKLLESFSDQYNLNSKKLMLNFSALNRIRGEIAHTGLFQNNYSVDFLIELLSSHQFALQVLILLELGYKGMVVSSESKVSKYSKIEEFLK